MKKIITVLIVIHCFFQLAEGQWIQQDSLVNYSYLNVKFLNKNTGWISGLNGTIVKTTNGGENWVIQKNIPGKLMYGLHIVDSNIVYAVGWFETILKTTNGGSDWIEIQNGSFGEGHSYEAVFFINKDTGWITRTGNMILKTTNGGLSFDSAIAPARCYDVYFRNENEGLACGQTGSMFKTIDGGQNWTEIYVPVATKSADFYRLTFVNSNTGYTQGVQNGKIYKTTNFGLTWDSLSRIPQAYNMRCIFFSSYYVGWSCGNSNQLYKTTDAGYTWKAENTTGFNSYGFGAVYFVNDSIGWSVGGGGKIINTMNGGQTLVKIQENFSEIPPNFILYSNFPNPFNSQTKIKFTISKNGVYKMEIFNSIGQLKEILFNEFKDTGEYEFNFNAEEISSGVYYYKLSNGKESQLKKFLLIK